MPSLLSFIRGLIDGQEQRLHSLRPLASGRFSLVTHLSGSLTTLLFVSPPLPEHSTMVHLKNHLHEPHDMTTHHAPLAVSQAENHVETSPVMSCSLLSIERHLERSATTLKQTALNCQPSILRAADMITACFQRENKLLLCGNGGSAAECQHMAAELTHRLSAAVIRRALPALALTTDTSFLTACSNDDGFRYVFARQVEALGQAGDVLLALSTSGNSENVVAAIEQARSQGLQVISLCGQRGQMAALSDEAICIPADDTQSIQEAHLAIVHILCGLVELAFVR